MQDKEAVHLRALRLPLHELYYTKDLETVYKSADSELSNFYSGFGLKEARIMLNALNWAVENPYYDYKSLLPCLRFNNGEIYRFLSIVRWQFQRKWGPKLNYGLPSDRSGNNQ